MRSTGVRLQLIATSFKDGRIWDGVLILNQASQGVVMIRRAGGRGLSVAETCEALVGLTAVLFAAMACACSSNQTGSDSSPVSTDGLSRIEVRNGEAAVADSANIADKAIDEPDSQDTPVNGATYDASRLEEMEALDAGASDAPLDHDVQELVLSAEVLEIGMETDLADVCAPACLGKECGNDGCGGLCGLCPGENAKCIQGECVCTPDCGCKQCGSDGCGGNCGECPDGNGCQQTTCDDGVCRYVAQPEQGCCNDTADCEDGDPCTDHFCYEQECLTAPATGCCGDDAECGEPDICEVAHFCDPLLHVCDVLKKDQETQKAEGLECCQGDEDCQAGGLWEEDTDADGQPGPDDPDSVDLCIEGLCVHVENPWECGCGPAVQDDCPPNEHLCKENICVEECVCVPDWIEGCCLLDSDCKTTNVGVTTWCQDNLCISEPKPWHCDSDWMCYDGNLCNWYTCFLGMCYKTPNPNVSDCCMTNDDCDDCDDCTVDTCGPLHTCEHVEVGCAD